MFLHRMGVVVDGWCVLIAAVETGTQCLLVCVYITLMLLVMLGLSSSVRKNLQDSELPSTSYEAGACNTCT